MMAMVVGVPGTGKSFFMVSKMKKHFTYDDFFHEYEIQSNYLFLTNIAGLKLYGSACLNIESPEILGNPKEGIKGKFTREEFFTVKNMEFLRRHYKAKNVMLVIDEIQQAHYFPIGYTHPDVNFLWEYHRHIGMDILFGTQNIKSVSRVVVNQCEYLAHGKLRSKKIMGAMSYRFTDNVGGYMYDKTLRVDKQVFGAYQSASNEEANKPKSALLHWFLITSVFLLVAGGLFKYSLSAIANKSKPKTAAVQTVKAPVPVPVAPPVPVQRPVSSARLSPVLAAVAPVMVAAALPPDLPRVIGLVGDTDGKNTKYLLSTGQTATCKRKLNIGDIYIR